MVYEAVARLTYFTIVVTAQIEQVVIMTDGVHRYTSRAGAVRRLLRGNSYSAAR